MLGKHGNQDERLYSFSLKDRQAGLVLDPFHHHCLFASESLQQPSRGPIVQVSTMLLQILWIPVPVAGNRVKRHRGPIQETDHAEVTVTNGKGLFKYARGHVLNIARG